MKPEDHLRRILGECGFRHADQAAVLEEFQKAVAETEGADAADGVVVPPTASTPVLGPPPRHPTCTPPAPHGCRVAPPASVRHSLVFLLTRIGSWTNARWDQHLRSRYGDEATNEVIAWLKANGIHAPRGGRELDE